MGNIYIPHEILKEFCKAALAKKNASDDVIFHASESLVQTSLRGVDSHGIRLLPHYLKAIDAGRINPRPNYKFKKTNVATGMLDADHSIGHAAGAMGMLKAIEIAAESGIGCVAVYNSTHFGAAAYFSLLAAKRDMIGLSFTHADSLMLSYRGKRAFFGTNPISFAAPCDREEPFCLDMATSLVNWNKILQYRERKAAIPHGWGYDSEGNETNDPGKVTFLSPIGDYKGFGLSMVVEILCSLLANMPYGRDLTKMFSDSLEKKRFLGHFFIAINIGSFVDVPVFKRRLKELMDRVRSEPPLNAEHPVMVPDDPEKKNYKLRIKKGIPVDDATMKSFLELAKKINFDFGEM